MTPSPSILTSSLNALLNQRVKVFIASGRAYTGDLKKFDDEVVVIGGEFAEDPDSVVMLDQVSSFRHIRSDEEKRS